MSQETEKTNSPSNEGTPVARINPAKVPADQAKDGSEKSAFAKGLDVAGEITRTLFKPGENEQRPDRGLVESLKEYAGKKEPEGEKGTHGDLPPSDGKQPKPGLFTAMDAPLHGLTPDDVHFANEVDAALARRPRFGVRALSVTVAVMFACLIAWAAIASIDEVTHSDGQVVGSQRTQTIQNLEGGILRGIQVREGQIVEKGAVLAQLDNEMAASSYRDAVSKAIENQLALVRLEAEMKNEKPAFPADLRAYITRRLGVEVDNRTLTRAKQLLRDQELAYESRQSLLHSDIDVLKAQYDQRMHEVQEQEARKAQLSQSLRLAIDQRNTAGELMRRKNFARMEYLGLEQKVVELQGQVDMLNASIPKAKAAAEEAKQRIASREAEQLTNITQEIAKRRLELTSLRETLSAGGDRVTRTELRAPVRGTVKQIYINTVGGVVKPGEPIMDIVPLDDTLLVEAKVMPKDVAFLRPGQDVMVKVSAYDFSIYGGLDGKLESISADTIEDKRGDFYYLAKIRTQKTNITHNNEILPIIPGMMVTADIMIGKKTVLDYIMKPILKAKQNALTER